MVKNSYLWQNLQRFENPGGSFDSETFPKFKAVEMVILQFHSEIICLQANYKYWIWR